MAELFDPDFLYDDSDSELEVIATKERRAQWRHRRVGPPYIKCMRRVKYYGADLNQWLSDNRIQTNV